ncbi:MAG: sigma-70 family RNA polymerase sigma factor [Desulfomonile tiedjei]|nr:sigma-70 family RNA polymerase sigma factor [Desulfomonile tiedjei]
MNDADLVDSFRRGEAEAFSELVRRHSKPLTMMILRIVRDEEEAKDLSQIAFLKAYEGLPRFARASSFKTWLYSIAMNTVRDHLRKRRPPMVPEALEKLSDPTESAPERLDKERQTMRLRSAMEELPEKQRFTVQLRIYEGLDYREIAEILGGTTGGARGNFFQAVKSLREKLGSRK